MLLYEKFIYLGFITYALFVPHVVYDGGSRDD